jgi:ubiquitin-conjugating enzyme E2 Q
MCMELLLRQGWSAAYTVEAVILQVAATLVRGKGRVNFGASKNEYTLQKALVGLRHLSQMGNGAWTSKFADG